MSGLANAVTGGRTATAESAFRAEVAGREQQEINEAEARSRKEDEKKKERARQAAITSSQQRPGRSILTQRPGASILS